MTQSAAHFVDCDINPDTIAGWTDSRSQARDVWYPSNHSHLNGQEVQVLGDGAYLGTETVASGVVALDDGTTVNHVGLAYTSTVEPTKLDLDKTGLATTKKIVKAIVSFFDTLGGNIGDSTTSTHPIIFRDNTDSFGSPPSLFSGIKEQPFDAQYEREGNVVITQDQPLPMTIRGIILPVGAYNDSIYERS